jgi:pimeloyl-ACP methyl ester carboxylesterase
MRGEFLDLSGARLYYYAAGTRGAGVPVVFIHGFPTSGHLWADVISLMPPGHRLVVVDLLGYGRSDRPECRAVDVRGHATRMIELLDELRIERACVVGHGIGGGIAQSLAVRAPERVSHLCLLDSVAFDAWPSLRTRVTRTSLGITSALPPEFFLGVARRVIERGYADGSRAAHSIDLYLRAFAKPEGRDALIAHIRGLTNDETAAVGERLSEITAPTSIIWGALDRIVPSAMGRRLQSAIRGATLDILPGVGHFTPEEAPRPVADAIANLLTRKTPLAVS